MSEPTPVAEATHSSLESLLDLNDVALLSEVISAQQEIATAPLDLEASMGIVARRAMALTGATGAVVELLEGEELVYRCTCGSAAASLGMRLRAEGTLSGLCIEWRRPLESNDAWNDPRVNQAAVRQVGIRSMVCVPLVHRGRAVGVLKVLSSERSRFTPRHKVVLHVLSQVIAAALSQAAESEALAQLAEERERATRLKSEFVANVSHEIRTPLSGMLGLLSLLRELRLDPQQREYVETIERSGETLLALVNDLLDFSKIEAGHLSLEEVTFDLGELLEQVGAATRPLAEQKGLDLRLGAFDGPPHWRGDPSRLRQVLLNLVTNAIKFTSTGQVTVQVRSEAKGGGRSRLTFEVEDTGIGIAPEVLPTLFQPFIQADPSTTRRFGGTGLGLSICRRVIERMGGAIGVRSEVGVGSRFHFQLELDSARPPADAGERAFPSPTPARSLRVLVADDNAVNQKVAVAMLRRLGHRPEVVANGTEAVRAVEADAFDVVLMDCQMPEMDGFEATRRLRASNHARRQRPLGDRAHRERVRPRPRPVLRERDDRLPPEALSAPRARVRALALGRRRSPPGIGGPSPPGWRTAGAPVLSGRHAPREALSSRLSAPRRRRPRGRLRSPPARPALGARPGRHARGRRGPGGRRRRAVRARRGAPA